MAKKKLIRFDELSNYSNVVQPQLAEVLGKDYKLKGQWKQFFFKNNNPLVLELACGKGEYSVGLGSRYPNSNFLGLDIKGARIWYGATAAIDNQLKNVGFLRTRIDFITSFFAQGEVNEIWIIHPDPQPQKNRERKRLTSDLFLNRYRQILAPGGKIHLRTDSCFLFQYSLKQLQKHNLPVYQCIEDVYKDAHFLPKDETLKQNLRITTHYEQIFMEKGHKIQYLCFGFD